MVQSEQSLAPSAKKTSMRLELRKFDPSEYESYAGIRNPHYPHNQISAHEVKSFDDHLDRTKYYLQRYTCVKKDAGEIVGYGSIHHMPWSFNPHRYQGGLVVDKRRQNKGVGAFIYENLIRYLSQLEAREVWAGAYEDMPVSLHFMTKRGFRERMRLWESRLNPASVNLSKFAHYLDKAESAGIEIRTLAQELAEDPDCYRKLHELNQTLLADMPSPEPYTPVPYEEWLNLDMRDPGLLPEAYTIAKHRDKYVGLSTARRLDKEPKGLHQLLTGVRREYRGKGIAFAMKLRVLEWAQKNGIESIRTENATNNEPMLAVNIKLGFQRKVGQVFFSKTL